jgi:NAD(P)-dependent dehydrogenase (short-subunit alcohol dehydrogenase family)
MEARKGRLDGKVAIVTASTQGIGFAIAERFGQEGASVVVSSRKQVPFLACCSFVFFFF